MAELIPFPPKETADAPDPADDCRVLPFPVPDAQMIEFGIAIRYRGLNFIKLLSDRRKELRDLGVAPADIAADMQDFDARLWRAIANATQMGREVALRVKEPHNAA